MNSCDELKPAMEVIEQQMVEAKKNESANVLNEVIVFVMTLFNESYRILCLEKFMNKITEVAVPKCGSSDKKYRV